MMRPDREISRRNVLGSIAGFVAAGALPLASRAQDGSPVASPAAEGSPAASPVVEGEWSFTDDRGVTVTLPKRPERIVADLSAAAPLWDFGIRPLAVSGYTVTTDAAWGNVDRSTPVIGVGEGLPEPDNEKLIDLQAELFISITWAPDDPTNLWSFSDPENLAVTEGILPIVAISATGSADVNMLRFAELAGLLGADLETPELAAAKADYEAAKEAFVATVTEKADISVLFGYIEPGAEWSAAYAPDWADLAWYTSLGLHVIEPNAAPGDYWETLSREQALQYPSDVFFASTRQGTMTIEELQADPTFGVHPAIAAGQTGGWNQDFIMSYQGLTAALANVTSVVSTAEKVT